MLSDTFRCNADILIEGVLELLFHVLDDEARPLRLLQVQSLGVVSKFDSVNPDKVDVISVFGSDSFNGIDVCMVLIIRRIDKEVCEGFRARCIRCVIVAIDFTEDGDGKFLDPFLEVFDRGRGDGIRICGCEVIEASINNDGGGSNACC